jgi:hypothetical protein
MTEGGTMGADLEKLMDREWLETVVSEHGSIDGAAVATGMPRDPFRAACREFGIRSRSNGSSAALVPTNAPAAMQLAYELGARMSVTGLEVTNTDLDYDGWENIGRCIDFVGSAWQWWAGDWLLLGEDRFGEESAQAIEDPASRYERAAGQIGMSARHLENITSVCRRIDRSRRRGELHFSHHVAVAPLEPADQERWLQAAIDGKLSKEALRAAIKEERQGSPASDPGPDEPGVPGVTPCERLMEVSRLVYHQSQRNSDGSTTVPAEAWAQFEAAIGEE